MVDFHTPPVTGHRAGRYVVERIYDEMSFDGLIPQGKWLDLRYVGPVDRPIHHAHVQRAVMFGTDVGKDDEWVVMSQPDGRPIVTWSPYAIKVLDIDTAGTANCLDARYVDA